MAEGHVGGPLRVDCVVSSVASVAVVSVLACVSAVVADVKNGGGVNRLGHRLH